jgi:hypothetical protein
MNNKISDIEKFKEYINKWNAMISDKWDIDNYIIGFGNVGILPTTPTIISSTSGLPLGQYNNYFSGTYGSTNKSYLDDTPILKVYEPPYHLSNIGLIDMEQTYKLNTLNPYYSDDSNVSSAYYEYVKNMYNKKSDDIDNKINHNKSDYESLPEIDCESNLDSDEIDYANIFIDI